ncbi:MAG: VanZ family protein [Chitinophagaceae bacterium]|nr:VanZ family protein [Chitinophagaceae bacterium]
MITSKQNIKKFIPGIAWFFLVLVLICIPSSNLPDDVGFLKKISFDKWVHAGLFGVLALLFILPVLKFNLTQKQKINYAIKITLSVIVWGLATEFIQKYFITGRFFDWFDWLADSSGALLAFIFCKKRVAI